MSTPVTYIGTQYNIPAYQDTGYAQGAGNLSSYLIALATGGLTLSGGSFPLTADANFGGSFGLVSLYYKSRTASIATTGQIRLAAADAITFSTSNYSISTDGSGNLTWRGAAIATSAGAVTSITGTANQVVASAAVGAVTLSLPQSIAAASTPTFASLTLTATTNQLILGTTRTVTFTAPTPASTSRVVTFPDLSGDYSVVGTIAAQTIAGAKTFSSAMSLTAASNQIVFQVSGAGNTVTVNLSAAPAASVVYTLPDAGGAASFVMTAGTQTIGGAKTFSSLLTPSAGVKGVSTNTNATAGNVDEYVESVVGATVFPTSTQWGDLTSISLTAGDWDITFNALANYVSNTFTDWGIGISVTSGNSATGLVLGSNSFTSLTPATATLNVAQCIANYRQSLSGTTTIYAKFQATWVTNAQQCRGRLSARRRQPGT